METAGDFSSAEFGGPAGVGNQMDGLFDAPHFHVVKPPNLVNQKGHSNSHGGDQHGGDQKGSTVNVKKVTAAKTEDKGQKNPSANQNTGGGHPGDDVGNFFDIKKFAAARTQDGGQQSSSGNQNTGLHDPDMLSDFFDQLQNIGLGLSVMLAAIAFLISFKILAVLEIQEEEEEEVVKVRLPKVRMQTL